jgi:hypothetical protein
MDIDHSPRLPLEEQNSSNEPITVTEQRTRTSIVATRVRRRGGGGGGGGTGDTNARNNTKPKRVLQPAPAAQNLFMSKYRVLKQYQGVIAQADAEYDAIIQAHLVDSTSSSSLSPPWLELPLDTFVSGVISILN